MLTLAFCSRGGSEDGNGDVADLKRQVQSLQALVEQQFQRQQQQQPIIIMPPQQQVAETFEGEKACAAVLHKSNSIRG